MRITVFTNGFPVNNKEHNAVFVKDFVTELSINNKVTVVCAERSGEKEEFEEFNVKWIKWPSKNLRFHQLNLKNPFSWISLAVLIVRGFFVSALSSMKKKQDVNFVLWTLPWGIIALFLKKLLGIPYAVWVLGGDVMIYGNLPVLGSLVRIVLKNADNVFADGFKLMNVTEEFSSRKCEFLASTRKLPVAETKKTLPEDIINFLFMGRLVSYKGVDLIVEAAKKVSDTEENFMINIIGDGELKESLKDAIQKQGLQDRVKLLGRISLHEGAAYLEASDCMLMPFRMASLPIVLSDSTKFSLPMIVTDEGDLGIIKKYNAGIVIKSGDDEIIINELASAIKQFIGMKSEEISEMRKGSAELNKLFDIPSNVKKLESFLGKNVLSSN